MRMRSLVALALLAVSLTACAGTTTSAEPSASAPAPAVEPTPTPTPDPTPAEVVVSATGIALLDSDGSVIEELSLQAEDPATFAAAVGAAVGTPAVEELVEGGPEGAAMTASYSWVGLKITSYFSPGECGGTDCRGTFVSLTSPNSGGLTLRTVSGISVGDTVESTMSLGARSTREIPLAAEPEDPELFDSETESTRIVILDVSVDESVIDTIRAGGMHTHGNI